MLVLAVPVRKSWTDEAGHTEWICAWRIRASTAREGYADKQEVLVEKLALVGQ